MSALHELERALVRAVDAGAAAAPPAPAPDASAAPPEAAAPHGAAAPAHASAQTPVASHGRRWRPRGRRLLIAILLAGGATTGALAATGSLPIGREHPMPAMEFLPDEGQGVRNTPVQLLPLRVADPMGGPPWVIRTFHTTQHGACAQAGQLYRGQFGQVERAADGHRIFRRIGIHLGETARCTNSQTGGFPVLRGLRTTVIVGGRTSREVCPAPGEPLASCPIRDAEVIRWGLLGPQARSARFVAADGSRGTPLTIAPGTGGAYVVAERIDLAALKRADAVDREIQRLTNEHDAALGPGVANPRTKAERAQADHVLRERVNFQVELMRRFAKDRPSGWAQIKDGVDATFADGSTFRVAGHGVSRRPLPGITPVRDDLPGRLPARVHVTYTDRAHAVVVRFAAPAPLDRLARAYIVTVRGLVGPRCAEQQDSYEAYITRAPTKGFPVVARVKAPTAHAKPRSKLWCKGATYTVRVRHHSGTNPGGRDREVGTTSFVAR